MATNIRTAYATYKVSAGGGMNMVDLQKGTSIIDTRIRGFGYSGSTAATIIRLADASGTVLEQPIPAAGNTDTIYLAGGAEAIVSTSDPESRTYIYYG